MSLRPLKFGWIEKFWHFPPRNYIRGFQPTETKIIVDESKNGDGGGHFGRNLLMVPPAFGHDTLKMDKECQTANPLQRGVKFIFN